MNRFGVFALASFSLLTCLPPPVAKAQGAPPLPNDLSESVISRAPLNPPLESRPIELRFSRDGSELLFQDQSLIDVISLKPPRIELTIPAAQVLPARFSADSQDVVLATSDMSASIWSIAQGKVVQSRTLGTGDACLAATLSSDGRYYACLDRDSTLHVFESFTGSAVLNAPIGETADMNGRAFLVPYHRQLARSQPFGYAMTSELPLSRESFDTQSILQFSPDGNYVFARNRYGHAAVVSIQTKKRIHLSRALRDAFEHDSFAFAGPSRIIAASAGKKGTAELISFPAGSKIKTLAITGAFRSTSSPTYAIDLPDGAKSANVIDVETGAAAARITTNPADVLDGRLVYCTYDGMISFARIGSGHLGLGLRMPISLLPVLRAVAVSPSLQTLAVGITGQGGVYHVQSGKRITSFDELRGGWCDSDQNCYLQLPGEKPLDSTVVKFDAATSTQTNAWSFENHPIQNENIFSGPVMLAHYLKEMIFPFGQTRFPYELHGLDATNGKLLWTKAFGGDVYRIGQQTDVPLVFTDPQGDRVVLGWPAESKGARDAAEHFDPLKRRLDQVKVSDRDTVFEVLDARTGREIGAALVQLGAGPDSFDEAFSEGNWLILVREGRDFTTVSLPTQAATEVQDDVYDASLSGEKGLLSVAVASGRLLLYDLNANAARNDFSFHSNVIYTHFSQDGKRLLVLTQEQIVYILDVTHPSEVHPSVSGATPPAQPATPGDIVLRRR